MYIFLTMGLPYVLNNTHSEYHNFFPTKPYSTLFPKNLRPSIEIFIALQTINDLIKKK